MGLIVSVYYNDRYRKCAAGGISERHDDLTVVNVSGPFEPTDERPAALLVKGNLPDTVKIVPATNLGTADRPCWVPAESADRAGPMFGGSYAGTCDGRFGEAVARILGSRFRYAVGPVPIHDRYESWADYEMMSR